MSKQNNAITLYPSNWLYNAGIVGMAIVQENNKEPIEVTLMNDGSFVLYKSYFESIPIGEKKISKAIVNLTNYLVNDEELTDWLNEDKKERKRKSKKDTANKNNKREKESNKKKYKNFADELGDLGYRFIRTGNKLFASKTPYQNLVQLSEWQSYEFPDLVAAIPLLIEKERTKKCELCNNYSIKINNVNSKLELRLAKLQSAHLKGLGPSLGEFPNSFWNMNHSMGICPLCSFLIIHHHLSFTKLADNSEIFINAPSFRIMFELNKFAKETYGSSNRLEARSKREILATSVIEYTNKIKTSLGIWAGMNIEIVTKKKDFTDFFSIPYDVIRLISDRKIAHLLSDLGEYNIYNKMLDRKFTELINISQKLLRISAKEQLNKSDNDLINSLLYRRKNKNNLTQTANKILKLYSLIEDKMKGVN